MNALEIIAEVRRLDADVVVRDDRLVVEGAVGRLPDSLRQELRQHKAELMLALGASMQTTLGSVLSDLRPHLPRPLKGLPDDRLLMLLNWSILVAYDAAARRLKFVNGNR